MWSVYWLFGLCCRDYLVGSWYEYSYSMHSRLILFWIILIVELLNAWLYLTWWYLFSPTTLYNVFDTFFVISCVLWIPCALRTSSNMLWVLIALQLLEMIARFILCASSVDISFASSTYTCHYLFMEIIIDAIDTNFHSRAVLSIASIFSLHPRHLFLPYFSMHQSLWFSRLYVLCKIILCFITTIG